PPPPPGGGGCGGIGAIFVAVIAVVAVVMTAGAAAVAMGAMASGASFGAAMGAVASAGFAGVATAGAAVMTGAMAGGIGLAAAAIGGAVGSIVSQGVAMAMGMQDKFSWGQVGLSAFSAAATAGLAGSGGVLSGTGVPQTVMRTMAVNAATQGVAMMTGLQKSFSWTSVAASGVAAWVTSSIKPSSNVDPLANIGYGTLRGMAGGTIQSVLVNDHRPNWSSLAANSFGSAVGDQILTSIRNIESRQGRTDSKSPRESRLPFNLKGVQAAVDGMAYMDESNDMRPVKVAQAGGHFYLPSLLANAAGIYDDKMAMIIAFSQFPDQVSGLDGFTNGVRNIMGSGDVSVDEASLLSEKALHALNGKSVVENVAFYQSEIAKYKDDPAYVGILLHGLVDSVFHSHIGEDGIGVTYEAPLGHGLHGSDPDYISRDKVMLATTQLIAAFETISGNNFGSEARGVMYDQVNRALNIAEAKAQDDVDMFNHNRDMLGGRGAGSSIDFGERVELNFREVVKAMSIGIPNVKLEDLPSPFFRGPIMEEGVLQESRTFFHGMSSDEADVWGRRGMNAALKIMSDFYDKDHPSSMPHESVELNLYDKYNQPWSFSRFNPLKWRGS
ncbi:hypothetical protein LQR31_06320, partial [Chromobacterium vaccinii]|uniref:hypothetical protein n=1 Tax=Chromobacterium vaccinii TaxID=1108595 RepID=UPI001E33B65C